MQQVSFPLDQLPLLIKGVEWQADSVAYNGGRNLGPFVMLVDNIKAQGENTRDLTVHLMLSDADLELINDSLEQFFEFHHSGLFKDDVLAELIATLRTAEETACMASGKKPPMREALTKVDLFVQHG